MQRASLAKPCCDLWNSQANVSIQTMLLKDGAWPVVSIAVMVGKIFCPVRPSHIGPGGSETVAKEMEV